MNLYMNVINYGMLNGAFSISAKDESDLPSKYLGSEYNMNKVSVDTLTRIKKYFTQTYQ